MFCSKARPSFSIDISPHFTLIAKQELDISYLISDNTMNVAYLSAVKSPDNGQIATSNTYNIFLMLEVGSNVLVT